MADSRIPDEPPICLERSYVTTQRGGTLIAEHVWDLAQHEQRVREPNGYRPRECPRCGHVVLHIHDYRERVLRADPQAPRIRIVRYQCAGCRAIWRTLPAFVARHLWRSWRVVESKTLPGCHTPAHPMVPRRTTYRWASRLAAMARRLLFVAATSGIEWLEKLAGSLGKDSTRREFVDAYFNARCSPLGTRIAEPAILMHRLEPGLRLL